jgi:hypothetical protein
MNQKKSDISQIGDIDKIDLSYVVREESKVYLVLACAGYIDGDSNMQKALLDKMQGYIGHIQSDWFKQEYQEQDPVTVIHFEEEPHQLILQLLSKCIAWFNDYGIELRFELKDSYFNITQSEE